MKKPIKKAEQKAFFFKVKFEKINKSKAFQKQVFNVSELLANKYGFDKKLTSYKMGLSNDDFVYNQTTLKITLKRYVLK